MHSLVKIVPTLALCAATECCRIPKHIIEANFCCQSELIIADFGVSNGASSLVYPTNNIAYSREGVNKGVVSEKVRALELHRSHNLHRHDRFQNDRLGALVCLSE